MSRPRSPDRRGSERSPHPRLRLSAIGAVTVCLFGAMLARLWSLQVLHSRAYAQAASSNAVRLVATPAPRGLVLSREGDVLVGNQPVPTVALSRTQAAKDPQEVARLAAVLGTTPADLHRRLKDNQYSPYKPVPVGQHVAMSTVVYLSEHRSQFPGVSVSDASERSYPQGATAAHLLGHVGDITSSELARLKGRGLTASSVIGKDGVEAAYDAALQGDPGQQRVVVDAAGKVTSSKTVEAAAKGDSLVLTLDLGLQKTLQKALAAQIARIHGTTLAGGQTASGTSGAAVVLDPSNGSVLAMASYPSFDPSAWVGGISQAKYAQLTSAQSGDPLLNRAIAGLYTPGSTFKLATATAALKTGLITPGSVIDDPGYFRVPQCSAGCLFHNAGHESLGPLHVQKAIAASDDVFFYTLGYRFWANRSHYGNTPIQSAANAYGLGVPTGIPIPGESAGRIDSPHLVAAEHAHNPSAFPHGGWYAGNNIEMAFGQGGTVITPLQLATAYATFANGGTRYQPRVAAAVVDHSGKVVKKISPAVTGHVSLPPKVRSPILAGLEGAVSAPYGTAHSAFTGFPLSSFPVAGKTGTASHQGKAPDALFVAFAPANHPRYVVAVVISQAGYGASVSAPVARQALDYLVAHPVGPVKLGASSASGG